MTYSQIITVVTNSIHLEYKSNKVRHQTLEQKFTYLLDTVVTALNYNHIIHAERIQSIKLVKINNEVFAQNNSNYVTRFALMGT